MFDWNDEELANIIWGEEDERDDHIVPYLEVNEDVNKKELNWEHSGTKLTELKRPEAKADFDERKLGSSSNLDNEGELPAFGYGTNSWPDLSLSSSAKIDQCSLGTEVSKNLSELSKFSSSRGEEIAQHEKDAEIFQNAHEGKEQGDFVDYGWANIGSFDDLDRIFSNDDPIFGHVSLDNSNELWSSKDVSNNPAPLPLDTPSSSGALSSRTEPLEIKEEYVHCNDESLDISYGDPASQVIKNSCTITDNVGSDGVGSKPTGKGQQVSRQKEVLKIRKKSQVKQEENALQDFYGNWSPSSPSAAQARQFENQLPPSVIQSSPPSIIGQPKQIQGAKTLYQNVIHPYVASSVCRNLINTYPAKPMLSQAQSRGIRHQPMLSGYEVTPGIVNPVNSVQLQTMTPPEKIEKLRKRQQMQAMLAIQKQRQQLGHHVLGASKPSSQKCPPEIQSHLSDGTDEDIRTLTALNPPIEQDGSNTMSVTVGNDFVEDTVLYRLQDIISKLDVKIRLCIRDSLFRLAQSATQRHYANDTSSTNKSSREELEGTAKEESNSQNSLASELSL